MTYNILRKWSKTLLVCFTSTAKFKQPYEPESIKQFAKNRHQNNPQNLYVWNKDIDMKVLNEELKDSSYKLINDEVKQAGIKQKNTNILDTLNILLEKGYGPIAV